MQPLANESELIARVLIAKDQHAFSQLVQHYQQSIRQYCRRLCASDFSLADDISQETFLQAFRKLHLYKGLGKEQGRGKLLSWLFRIAYFQFLQYLRAKKNTQSLDDEQEAVSESLSEQLNAEMDIETAMKYLKPKERVCLTLQYSFGYSQSQISDMLDFPLGSVKSYCVRGKDKLAELLADRTT